jgi:NAD(P)-dependent dehydrogenase (short-subunit alcohol dehydrogenase family)
LTIRVLLTGASRGIGAATARYLADRHEASLVLVARDRIALEEVASDCAGARDVAVVDIDLSDRDAPRHLVQIAVDRFGGIDALINNAALLEPVAHLADVSFRAFRTNFEVGFLAPALLTSLALPHLRRTNGRIINLTSSAVGAEVPGMAAYSCSKGALEQLTRVVKSEEPEVTTIAVAPGTVDTDMHAILRSKDAGEMSPERVARFHELERDGLLLPPEEVGRGIAQLAIRCPPGWSGRCLRLDEPDVQDFLGRF